MRATKSSLPVRPPPRSRREDRPPQTLISCWGPADAERVRTGVRELIVESGALCREIEEQLRHCPAPELEMIIRLYRALVLKLSAQLQATPELLPLVVPLLKPVMDWARIEEQRQDRELERQKHKDRLARQPDAREKTRPGAGKALSDSTRKIIERELKLF